MNDLNNKIFIILFKEVCRKCFGTALTSSLTETDSKLLSNTIFEKTGLIIGAKSIKNYSVYVTSSNRKGTNQENPSVATLDTFARYVLNAPYTDEIKRKSHEGHYPYWFQFRSKFAGNEIQPKVFQVSWRKIVIVFVISCIIIIGFFAAIILIQKDKEHFFKDDFNYVSNDSLLAKGWIIISKDTAWWNKNNEKQGHLTLFTLKGDNWPLGNNKAGIKNLLIRKIESHCFLIEVHLTEFVPKQNWQQAGILLSEDSLFSGKMIRLSISYNDFFGGYEKPSEIIIQAISSAGSGNKSKPEEIIHLPLFSIEKDKLSLARNNLSKSALKVEKQGDQIKFLYSVSPFESFTFKEAGKGTFNINPRYVGIFSIQGWSDKENIPSYFDWFSLIDLPCNQQ